MVEKANLLQWSQRTRDTPTKKNSKKYCRFHRDKGHDTEDSYQLKNEIERLVRQGYFKEYILRESRANDAKGVGANDVGAGEQREERRRSRSAERYRGRNREEEKMNNALQRGHPHDSKRTDRRKLGQIMKKEAEEYKKMKMMERIEPVEEHKEIELVHGESEKVRRIGSHLIGQMETMTIEFLRKNSDMFAWSPSNFKGINPEVIMHRLNVDLQAKPVKQKKRSFGMERNKIIEEEVEKLLKAGVGSGCEAIRRLHRFSIGGNANRGFLRNQRIVYDTILEKDPIAAKRLRFRVNRFTMLKESYIGERRKRFLLKCLGPRKANYVLREIHEGSCENHSGGRSLAQKVTRQGYFWPTLVKDAMEFTKKCESCQRYASLIHSPTTPTEPVKIACPLDQWGDRYPWTFPTGACPKKFIIVTVEYFSKWIEAEALSKISEKEGKKIMEWCKGLKIQQNFTAIGNPQANGQMKVS
ncbi:UNVERIFIED_CONTAM: hypothetical protein Scaly_2441500 [Sesamum calycinum]|uniref:Integrase zinc-binding domain-containing protein n=1 Tax=Sesamum calycinum TaxID=2727403 RepID=A0AAW2M1Q9_9LAMI